jgi:hypothetical protein
MRLRAERLYKQSWAPAYLLLWGVALRPFRRLRLLGQEASQERLHRPRAPSRPETSLTAHSVTSKRTYAIGAGSPWRHDWTAAMEDKTKGLSGSFREAKWTSAIANRAGKRAPPRFGGRHPWARKKPAKEVSPSEPTPSRRRPAPPGPNSALSSGSESLACCDRGALFASCLPRGAAPDDPIHACILQGSLHSPSGGIFCAPVFVEAHQDARCGPKPTPIWRRMSCWRTSPPGCPGATRRAPP